MDVNEQYLQAYKEWRAATEEYWSIIDRFLLTGQPMAEMPKAIKRMDETHKVWIALWRK